MATYKPLQSIFVPSATSSITFSNIDQGYTDLILVSTLRYTSSNVGQGLQLRFNGDSAANYSATVLEGDGSAASSYRGTGGTAGIFNAPSNGSQTSFSPVILHINNYTSTVNNKSWLSRNSGPTYVNVYVGRWAATPQAITSITIIPSGTAGNIDAGCTFDLYGIKSGAPQALGGDLVTTDGNYWYHTFNTTQTFTTLRPLTVDYLVIAGGGGGGKDNSSPRAGGGGAGGYLTSTMSIPALVNSTVTVGAGGVGSTNSSQLSSVQNGSNSVFYSITAIGGGGGGQGYNGGNSSSFNNGATGGSGGGSGMGGGPALTIAGGSNTSGQGNAGGQAISNASFTSVAGGGGGGAGAVGQGGQNTNTSNAVGGAGGSGAASSITGSSVTRAGGGGAQAVASPGTAGAGGSGGGGAGSNNGTGGSGTSNTGSGGGAGQTGGAGGSGIVIVRYPV